MTAPPPRNGSKYVPNLFGKFLSNSAKSCLLPPAHLTNGLASCVRICVYSRVRHYTFGKVFSYPKSGKDHKELRIF